MDCRNYIEENSIYSHKVLTGTVGSDVEFAKKPYWNKSSCSYELPKDFDVVGPTDQRNHKLRNFFLLFSFPIFCLQEVNISRDFERRIKRIKSWLPPHYEVEADPAETAVIYDTKRFEILKSKDCTHSRGLTSVLLKDRITGLCLRVISAQLIGSPHSSSCSWDHKNGDAHLLRILNGLDSKIPTILCMNASTDINQYPKRLEIATAQGFIRDVNETAPINLADKYKVDYCLARRGCQHTVSFQDINDFDVIRRPGNDKRNPFKHRWIAKRIFMTKIPEPPEPSSLLSSFASHTKKLLSLSLFSRKHITHIVNPFEDIIIFEEEFDSKKENECSSVKSTLATPLLPQPSCEETSYEDGHSNIKDLPNELLIKIFKQNFSSLELHYISLACEQFYRVTREPSLWPHSMQDNVKKSLSYFKHRISWSISLELSAMSST